MLIWCGSAMACLLSARGALGGRCLIVLESGRDYSGMGLSGWAVFCGQSDCCLIVWTEVGDRHRALELSIGVLDFPGDFTFMGILFDCGDLGGGPFSGPHFSFFAVYG